MKASVASIGSEAPVVSSKVKLWKYLRIIAFCLVHPVLVYRALKLAISAILSDRARKRHDQSQIDRWYEDNR